MNNNITEAAFLVSEMNPNMGIIIIPKEPVGFHNWFSISSTANNAYYDWFENERADIGDSTIGDYIENRLEKNGYILGEDYKMYFDAQWDRNEILV